MTKEHLFSFRLKGKDATLLAVLLSVVIMVMIIHPFPLVRACGTASYDGGLTHKTNNNAYRVPLDIVIVESEKYRFQYSHSEIETILENTNAIWHKANVGFWINSIQNRIVSDGVIDGLSSGNEDALKSFAKSILLERFEDKTIDVIFLKEFSEGAEDRALAQGRITVAFVTELDEMRYVSWTLAHELGHILGLCDVFEPNLMMDVQGWLLRIWYRDTYLPENLTVEQIGIVHNTIERKFL